MVHVVRCCSAFPRNRRRRNSCGRKRSALDGEGEGKGVALQSSEMADSYTFLIQILNGKIYAVFHTVVVELECRCLIGADLFRELS